MGQFILKHVGRFSPWDFSLLVFVETALSKPVMHKPLSLLGLCSLLARKTLTLNAQI